MTHTPESTTHWACQRRLAEYGGESKCCACYPHKKCGASESSYGFMLAHSECLICGNPEKKTIAEWNKCPWQFADWKAGQNFPFLSRVIVKWWYFRKNPKHLYDPNLIP